MLEFDADVESHRFAIADFRHVPTRNKYLALMPQWDFLDMIASAGRALPDFRLQMESEAVDVLRDEKETRITGVRVKSKDGEHELFADLVIGADGRRSKVREAAKLEVLDLGAPIDVLWMRLPRREGDPAAPLGRFGAGYVFVMIYRGDYWQCALVIPKGGFEPIRRAGIEAFRRRLATLADFAGDRVQEIKSWYDVRLLTVAVDRARHWSQAGLLLIGDAAHAMSPVGGVGINLAVQDAVAAANLLGPILLRRPPSLDDLQAVEQRRLLPVRVVQAFQTEVHNRVLASALAEKGELTPPLPLKWLDSLPVLRRLPAWFMGVGLRPEHVTFGRVAA